VRRVRLVIGLAAIVAATTPAAARSGGAAPDAGSAMIDRINEVRAGNGLRPLRASSSLSGTSRRFAKHLMRRDALYHRARPSTSRRYRRAGEILAMHIGRRDRVAATLRSWMRSPTHRSIILGSSWRELGAGVAHGRFGRRRAVVWVVQTGRR
jgi:uncharacterized protein YkwD